MVDSGYWAYSPDHGQLCQVIETQTLWGEKTCRVWLPSRNSVVCVPVSRLAPLGHSGTDTTESIAYVTSCCSGSRRSHPGRSARAHRVIRHPAAPPNPVPCR